MTVASYGDVTAEDHALHRGSGLVGGAYEAVRVEGPDAESFLDSLLSQDLTAWDTGRVGRALLLAPRGKLRAQLWVARLADGFVLVTDSGWGAAVAGDLTHFKLRVDVIIGEPETVEALIGPGSAGVLGDAGLPAPAGAHEGDPVIVFSPLGSIDRFFVIGDCASALIEAGAIPVGMLAATAARVEAGEPQMGRDVDEGTIPQEAGLVDTAVSFSKGCYLGQELVARIDSRGHVNRHLRGIVMTENRLPPEGAAVVAEGKEVGAITSVAESLQVGAPIGLGLIRREVEPPHAAVIRWEGGETGAQIRTLPLLSS